MKIKIATLASSLVLVVASVLSPQPAAAQESDESTVQAAECENSTLQVELKDIERGKHWGNGTTMNGCD